MREAIKEGRAGIAATVCAWGRTGTADRPLANADRYAVRGSANIGSASQSAHAGVREGVRPSLANGRVAAVAARLGLYCIGSVASPVSTGSQRVQASVLGRSFCEETNGSSRFGPIRVVKAHGLRGCDESSHPGPRHRPETPQAVYLGQQMVRHITYLVTCVKAVTITSGLSRGLIAGEFRFAA